jgi:hypothetical protein
MSNLLLRAIGFLASWLPLVKWAALFLGMALATVYLFRVQFTGWKWLDVCARAVGVLFVVPTMITLMLLVTAWPVRPQICVSPDSRHTAEYTYAAGFLGRDTTVVRIRSEWSIWPETAYAYEGPSNWTATGVRWLNSNTLLIEYYPDPTRFQECKTRVAGVIVRCVRKE